MGHCGSQHTGLGKESQWWLTGCVYTQISQEPIATCTSSRRMFGNTVPSPHMPRMLWSRGINLFWQSPLVALLLLDCLYLCTSTLSFRKSAMSTKSPFSTFQTSLAGMIMSSATARTSYSMASLAVNDGSIWSQTKVPPGSSPAEVLKGIVNPCNLV